MCDCRSDIEKRLLERVKGKIPEGSKNLEVSLGGCAFLFGEDGGLDMKNVMPINIEYQAPVKRQPGTFKTKKQKMNMTDNYCMFCGEKYAKEQPAEAPAESAQ